MYTQARVLWDVFCGNDGEQSEAGTECALPCRLLLWPTALTHWESQGDASEHTSAPGEELITHVPSSGH